MDASASAPDPMDMDENAIINGICDGDNPEPKPAHAILDATSGAASNAKKYASNPNLLSSGSNSSSDILPLSREGSFGSRSSNSSGSFQRINDADDQRDPKSDDDLVVMEPSSKSMDTLNIGSRRMSRIAQLQGGSEATTSTDPASSISPPSTLTRGLSRSTASLAPVRPPSGVPRRPSKAFSRDPTLGSAAASGLRRQSAMPGDSSRVPPQTSSQLGGSRSNLLGSKSNLSGSTGNLLDSRSKRTGSSGNLRRGSRTTANAAGLGTRSSNAAAAEEAVVEIDAALHNAERNIRASTLTKTTLPSIGGRGGVIATRESSVVSNPGSKKSSTEDLESGNPKGREASMRLSNPVNFTESFRTRIDAVNKRKMTMIREQLASMDPKADATAISQPLSDNAAAVTARLYQPTTAKPSPHTNPPPKRPPGDPPSASTSRRPVPPLVKAKTSSGGMDFFDAFAKGASSVEELRGRQPLKGGNDGKVVAAGTAGVVGDMPLRDGTLKQIHTYSVGNLTIIKSD
ncbi:hypothetical protein BCR44DRAFT_29414 [Catenaria anguillulae PL171]|uniref:Uncharacterized protein n=1 Tax=Catenaria anguillulae PL171 TaxID=765915 RepID=A0A1Y2HF72_9FUNG|nr:hypothetical protein BCR44DRAFT_29414 [Catenaria anguillulae PL171]